MPAPPGMSVRRAVVEVREGHGSVQPMYRVCG